MLHNGRHMIYMRMCEENMIGFYGVLWTYPHINDKFFVGNLDARIVSACADNIQ